MRKEIKKLGYEIDQKIISPIDFNIPQTRDRLYIVAKQKKLNNFKWPEKINSIPNLKNFLISNPKNIRKLTDNKKKLFNTGRNADFLEAIMEFGALICKPKLPNCSVCKIKNFVVLEKLKKFLLIKIKRKPQ